MWAMLASVEFRMDAAVDGRIFCRQTNALAERVRHVVAARSRCAHHVADDVVADVPDVGVAGRIGEHLEGSRTSGAGSSVLERARAQRSCHFLSNAWVCNPSQSAVGGLSRQSSVPSRRSAVPVGSPSRLTTAAYYNFSRACAARTAAMAVCERGVVSGGSGGGHRRSVHTDTNASRRAPGRTEVIAASVTPTTRP